MTSWRARGETVGEPVETRLPWARRPVKKLSQSRADHARLHPLVAPNPQPGKVQHYSVVTADYEPNRPMAPEPNDIIAKKGIRPTDIHRDLDVWDKIVIWSVITCMVLITVVIGAIFIELR